MNPDDIQSAIARAEEYNLRLDRALRETGIVNDDLFQTFASVQSDPNASSVGWLEAKLRVLSMRISSGAGLSLYEPTDGVLKPVDTLPGLLDWANRHFPVLRWRA